MSTGAQFAVFVGGMLVSLVVVVGILLGYVLAPCPTLPDRVRRTISIPTSVARSLNPF